MHRTFEASMDRLCEMLQCLRIKIRAAGFKGNIESQVELALEEALVNIIKHGYQNAPGKIEMHCLILPHPGIKVVLMDQGIPYNPLINVKNMSVRVQELKNKSEKIGGFGVFLMVKIMDKIDYEFKDGYNILSLTKFL